MTLLSQAQAHPWRAELDTDPRFLALRPGCGPLPVCPPARSSLLGEFISQTMFPHGELLAGGGREVLCELLKSENRKEVSRNLKQDKLITLWPKGSCGLAGL